MGYKRTNMVELELRHTELPLRWEIGKVPQACQDACGGVSAGVPPTARRLPLMPLYSGSVHHRQRPPDSESDEAGVDVRGQCAGPPWHADARFNDGAHFPGSDLTRPEAGLDPTCPGLPGTWTQALVGPARTALGSAKGRTRL